MTRFLFTILFLFNSLSAFSDSGVLVNPNLDAGLHGWHVNTDTHKLIRYQEDFDYGKRDKNVLSVARASGNDTSEITIDSTTPFQQGYPIYYFVKIGYNTSESAKFEVKILDKHDQVISSNTFRFDDNTSFHELYSQTPVPAPTEGKYKLRITAKNRSRLGSCFIYYAQLGTSLGRISLNTNGYELPDELANFSNKPQNGWWYKIKVKHSGQFLTSHPITREHRKIRQMRHPNHTHYLTFQLADAGEHAHYIQTQGDKCVFDLHNGESCSDVIEYEKTYADNQQWYLKESDDGYYFIESKKTGEVLDVTCESHDPLTPIMCYPNNHKDNQKFLFIHAD